MLMQSVHRMLIALNPCSVKKAQGKSDFSFEFYIFNVNKFSNV
jgi:hypothetical protein